MKTAHKQLCKIASDYLAGHRFNCPVVITEFSSSRSTEIPDALGFDGSGRSFLIECKVSKSDYYADKSKIFRLNEEMGLGDERYFLIPKGLINTELFPKKWGILEYYESGIIRMTKASGTFISNKLDENMLLVSAIRRLKLSTAVFVQPENNFSENFTESKIIEEI